MADALVIFKPDSSHRPAARSGFWTWLREERGWKLEALTWFQPPADLVESHYDFLRGRPFFPWLVDFMTALPVLVGRVSAEAGVLERMRHELGETRIQESRPGSLRERFGIYGGCNCMHLSDSVETGAREVALWSERCDLGGGIAEVPAAEGRPDHTFHLRSLAAQASAGVHAGLARERITALIREETDLDGAGFESLTRIIQGAF